MPINPGSAALILSEPSKPIDPIAEHAAWQERLIETVLAECDRDERFRLRLKDRLAFKSQGKKRGAPKKTAQVMVIKTFVEMLEQHWNDVPGLKNIKMTKARVLQHAVETLGFTHSQVRDACYPPKSKRVS